ncbi:MAG TPA: hypothetical protein VFC57_00620 [Aeromicrobium sp.]|nr:hypothetical protein [Aeromicrobium sp.]
MFLVEGSGPDTTTAGAKIIADYHKSNAAVQISGYALVIAAAVLIFFGAALRRALRCGHADWLAGAAFGGTMAMAIVGFVVTAYAMHDAVKAGDATVAQSINILDHANFVPAMLGLCCTFLATGLSSLRTGALPRWICLVSVILGVASPLPSGPPPSRHSRSSPYGLSSSRPSSPVACAPLTAKTQPRIDAGKLLRMPGAINSSNLYRGCRGAVPGVEFFALPAIGIPVGAAAAARSS